MNKRVMSLIMGGMLVVSNLGLSFADEETLIDDRLDKVVEEEVIKQFICRHCGEPYNVSDYHICDEAMTTCENCGEEYNIYDYHECDKEYEEDDHESIEEDESLCEEESCEDCGKVNCECVDEGDENYTDTPCEDCGKDLCECEDGEIYVEETCKDCGKYEYMCVCNCNDDIENVKKEYDKKLEETKKKYDKKLKEVVADKEDVKEVVNVPTKSNDKTYKTTSAKTTSVKSTSYSSNKVDNPKTSDMGVISAIGGLVTALGGLIFTRKH